MAVEGDNIEKRDKPHSLQSVRDKQNGTGRATVPYKKGKERSRRFARDDGDGRSLRKCKSGGLEAKKGAQAI